MLAPLGPPCCCSQATVLGALLVLAGRGSGGRVQESVKRDVEYAQQRVRLRLLERQEQLMRLARDASNRAKSTAEVFTSRAESLVSRSRSCSRSAGSTTDERFKATLCGAERPPGGCSMRSAMCCVLGDIEN